MVEVIYYKSQCGNLEICLENKKLLSINIVEDKLINKENTNKSEIAISILKQLDEYFEGKRKVFNIDIELKGTNFQKRVWNELLKIPYGHTKTYKDIAKAVGNEKASRAIGGANNKNPIMIIVPCHRVIGSNNKLVGYAGGLDVKERLLSLERNNM